MFYAYIFKNMAKRKKKPNTTEYIYHSGDDLQKIAKKLTGHSYLMYRMLLYSGIEINNIKEGDIIKWKPTM